MKKKIKKRNPVMQELINSSYRQTAHNNKSNRKKRTRKESKRRAIQESLKG